MVLWEFSQWLFPGRISYTGRRAPWSARCFHRSVLGDVVPSKAGTTSGSSLCPKSLVPYSQHSSPQGASPPPS